MAACNGAAAGPYRSPAADYWATTGAYAAAAAAAYSPAAFVDPLAAGTYCARAAATAGAPAASMQSCALNGSAGGTGGGGGGTPAGAPSRAAAVYSHEQNALARIYQNPETSW